MYLFYLYDIQLLLQIVKSSLLAKFSRLCSTINNENLTEWNNIKSKYTDEQLKLVLKTLNKCNLKEMKKFSKKN